MRRFDVLCFALAALVPFGALSAQSRHCADILRRVKAPAHAMSADRFRDLDQLLSCGAEGRQAAMVAFRNAKQSRDTTYLGRLAPYSWGIGGKPFLPMLLDLAADASASTEARVTAMISLRQMKYPADIIRYHDVVGGFVDDLFPVHGCSSGRSSGDFERVELTKEELRRINATAHRIRADASAPLDVRTAAGCLGG